MSSPVQDRVPLPAEVANPRPTTAISIPTSRPGTSGGRNPGDADSDSLHPLPALPGPPVGTSTGPTTTTTTTAPMNLNQDERPSSSRSNTRSILLPSSPIQPSPGGIDRPASPFAGREREVDISAVRLRDTRPEFALPSSRLPTSGAVGAPPGPANRSPVGSVQDRNISGGGGPGAGGLVDDGDDARTLSVNPHEVGYNTHNHPLPILPGELPSTGSRRIRGPQRTGTYVSQRRSEMEWREKEYVPLNLERRLEMTIIEAEAARNRYAIKARWSGYCLNAAIGLQVLLGSLTTGLSAVATNGRSVAIQTTILGGLATLVASYLARARGSGEPESSNSRVKALDGFLRRARNFSADHGHITGHEFDTKIEEFRKELEYLLGTGEGNTDRELKGPQALAPMPTTNHPNAV